MRSFVRLARTYLDIPRSAHDRPTDDPEDRHRHRLDRGKVGQVPRGPILRDVDEIVEVRELQIE